MKLNGMKRTIKYIGWAIILIICLWGSVNFSKEQEFEADYYSLETLKKLDIYSSSIIELLKTIEKKSLERGFDKNNQRISTHPYFIDRIEFTKYQNENKENTTK